MCCFQASVLDLQSVINHNANIVALSFKKQVSMASNSLFSSPSPMLYWGETPSLCLFACVCVCVSYIMLCSSGIKLILEAGRSLELEGAEPAMGLLITTPT